MPNQTRSIQVTLATDAAATATPAGAVGGALAVTFAAGGPREQAVDLVIGQLGAATLASSNDGGLANATTSVTVQDGFHFTATADPRTQVTKWDDVLAAINAKCGGPGAFHTSSGDIDPLQPLRDRIDSRFGAAALWYPGVGNHEAETVEDMAWIRAEYHTGNAVRVPLSGFTNQDGPAGTVETNYTFDVGNARFIQLNEYWNGAATPGSDVGAGGAIVPALQSWLTAKMAESNQAAVFVLGHEPAYPENRHVGDSLDANPAQRNQFWDSMESAGALSYICGHTHFYSTHQQPGGRIWQIDLGNAGNDGGDGLTFLNTVVMPAEVRYDVWRNAGGSWHLAESWLQPIPQRLRVTPTVMDRQVFLGKPLSADSFEVQAVGPGTLAYVINDDAPWLTVSESSGSSAGEADAIELSYATADLPVGQHTGRVTVSGPAGVAPRVLTVNLTVRTVKGDFDQDSDVDQDDFGHLQKCLNGSAPQLDPLCADARLDGDEYVNGGDIDRFLACYSGPEIEASPACEN